MLSPYHKNTMCLGRSLLFASCFFSLSFIISCQTSRQTGAAHSKSTLLREVIANSSGRAQVQEGLPLRLSPVHFGTNSDELLEEDVTLLDSNAAWLRENPRKVLVLEGHCDERGEDLYNMELGDRRARRVKLELIKVGIESDRLIMVVSYGKRVPLDTAHTRDAWRANRRVEFIVR